MTLVIARADTLNATAAAADARQLSLAADGAPIRVTYGRDRIGGQIVNVLAYGSDVVIQVLWGYALDAVEKVWLNDVELTSGVTSYTGSQTTADATLVAAFAARSPAITYTDTLAGLAYSVLTVAASSFSGSLNVVGLVRGRRVYDQRKDSTNGGSGSHRADTASTWEWSENPSLCLQDFLRSTVYGAGRTVDYASFAMAATWNDVALAVGEPHRKIGLTLAASQAVSSWIDTLRTYAGLYLSRRGGTYYAVQDKATSSVATYAHADGTVAGWSNLQKADLGNSPTLVEVIYTDTSQVPWRDRSAIAKLAGVDAGTIPYRLSTVRLPGIQRYSQALREATERLNKLQDDLSLTLRVFDRGIAHEIGDVVTVTLPIGLTNKLMRVAEAPQSTAPGEWELRLREYDPASYSLDVTTAPSYADTNLPAPTAVPALTSCTASEEIYQNENGLWFSRAKIVIAAPTFLWFGVYQFEVLDGTTLIHSGTSTQTTYRSPPLKDGPTYTCRARMVSVVGTGGAWSQATFTCDGKLAAPGDVPSLTGFEAGGDVYLGWQPAVDVDIWRYEIRYSATGGSWASSTLLDRVDALRYISKGVVPAGTWKFWVKALDSVGNYSANAASVTITVTVDPESLQTEKYFTSPTLTNMSSYQLERGGATWYVTDVSGDTFGGTFTSNLGTYTNALATYHTSATSTWQSEAFDFGVALAGDWQCEATAEAISGSYTLTLQLSDDGSSYTDYTAFPVKRTARYIKVKLSAATTSTFRVLAGSVRGWVNATTRKENGVKTVASTGTPTVSLDGKYFTYKSITLTPVANGAVAYHAVADAITLSTSGANSFAVYLFDAAGARVSGDVAWKFEGV